MAAFTYYALQALRDYYATGSLSAAGEWFGRGAKALGLVGEVARTAFEQLVRGFAPDGVTKLVQNAGLKDRFVGFDLTFSAPKSVSIVWALERASEARGAIERALMEAVKDALQFVEDSALLTRRGRGGAIVEQATGMVASLWLHTTSRRNDPQLHVHACIKNEVQRPDGTWGTILGITARSQDQAHRKSESAIFAIKMAAGQVFRQSLAQRIGAVYRTVQTQHGFEVDVPKTLIDHFSSRSREIRTAMEERGVSGAREAAKVALLTRTAKRAVRPDALFRRWQEEAHGFDPATLRSAANVRTGTPRLTADSSTTFEQDILRPDGQAKRARAFQNRLMAGPSPPRNAAAGERRRMRPGSSEEVRNVGRPDTRKQDDDLRTMRASALVARILKRSQRNRSHILTRANVYVAAQQVQYLGRMQFTAEEKAALVAITRKRGSVQFLGRGANADRILKAARIAFQRQGYRVLLATRSRDEADRIEKLTGIHSITARGLERGLRTNRGLLRGYDAAIKKSLSLGLGFRSGASFLTYVLKASGKWIRFDEKTVVIIDSSSLDLAERSVVMKKAHRAGTKLVFMHDNQEAADISAQLTRPRPAPEDVWQQRRREREQEWSR